MGEAKQDVNTMKAELAEKNKELAAKSIEVDALLRTITEKTAIAEKDNARVRGCWGGLSGPGVGYVQTCWVEAGIAFRC